MYSNILIPLAQDHLDAADSAVGVARKLAAEDAQITVMTVVEPIPDYVAQYLPEGQYQSTRKRVAESLENAAKDHPDLRVTVVTGHAGRAIVDFAQAQGMDCIIVSSHKPGLQDYFLGSTAARVVRHARCAVHVIR